MASIVKTGASDGPSRLPVKYSPTLRYQVHGATREVFWKVQHGCACWEQIHASAAYTAVYDGESGRLTPKFIGSLTKAANDYTDIPFIQAIKLALEHALKTVHRILRDEPGCADVSIIIFCDNLIGLQLMRISIKEGGPENLRTFFRRPNPCPAVLEETFMVHQKIEHMLGRNRVNFSYKYPAGNVLPFFAHKVVVAKCKQILYQMQEEYCASRRWNQVSLLTAF